MSYQTPDLAMILVGLMAEAHEKLPLRAPANTAIARWLRDASEHRGPTIKRLRAALQALADEYEAMDSLAATPEHLKAFEGRLVHVQAVQRFFAFLPRTPLTEPIVSPLITEGGSPPPPWCPVALRDLSLGCKVEGRDGLVLRWVLLSLAGWYAASDPGGPVKLDLQGILDGALTSVRKDTATLEPLAGKLQEGLTWVCQNPLSMMKLLQARTWNDIEPEPEQKAEN